jgi:hypothetical protein
MQFGSTVCTRKIFKEKLEEKVRNEVRNRKKCEIQKGNGK